MGQIKVEDVVIPFETRISTRAQRIIISIIRGQVKVSVPRGVTDRQVEKFVLTKQEWIYEHWRQYQAQQTLRVQKEYKSGQEFPYRGRNLTILVEEYDGKTIGVKLIQNTLGIYFPKTTPLEERSRYIKEALIYWYKTQARIIFQDKLDHYAAIMGVEYKGLRIKEQKTKWGSCSARGNINLNWKVVMAPEAVIDYLIIHELAHLKFLNHSQDFWYVVANYMVDYKQWKKWLKEHGRDLEM
ncbi:MAG: SprT family zinc-dependent metalloprotease [Desulfitobacteriaceae bacterium]